MTIRSSTSGFTQHLEYKCGSPKRQNILINLDGVIHKKIIIWDTFLVLYGNRNFNAVKRKTPEDFTLSYFIPLHNFTMFNPLNTKRRLLYLKTQFVPRSEHFSSRL